MSRLLKILLGLFALGVLAVVGVALWGYQQLQPVQPSTTDTQRFVIAKGSTVTAIATKLEAARLINSAIVFRIYARYSGLEKQFQAGSYELSAGMPLSEVATKLTSGSEDVWVTILEGWRKEEIAEYLASQELPEFSAEEFVEIASTSEGMLFPDTYLIPRESTASSIYALLTRTFEQKVTTPLASEIANSQFSIEELIVLASLIQREAKTEQDMRHVSSILQNRIEIGMPLQVDATLQYLAGYDSNEKSWWAQPDIAVKQSQSPFNSYTNPGLPPSPIANPGLQAIEAALNPLETDDIFYLHAPDGTMYYAKDLDTHNQYIERYLR